MQIGDTVIVRPNACAPSKFYNQIGTIIRVAFGDHNQYEGYTVALNGATCLFFKDEISVIYQQSPSHGSPTIKDHKLTILWPQEIPRPHLV